MATTRPATAIDPLLFGRRSSARDPGLEETGARLQDDLRLFSATFAAGFLFVSVLIF
ncbi:MAG TPA: hypothetical protein VFS45_06225 [Sphingomicrobium sp.]|nr:hypothetical protein [Sphingomicrobium sp.]